ncbi:MAG: type IV-A pilus assembly ATPase PilB [Methylacidiphilales bacterium]|nr:type IV-A pilus assembly ATPase PilB [Candidatus Methylacidiphilales bacterium]
MSINKPLSATSSSSAISGFAIGGLPKLLIAQKKLDEFQVRELIQAATDSKKSFIEVLLEKKALSALEIAEVVSVSMALPIYDLDTFQFSFQPETSKLITQDFCKQHFIIPLLKRGEILFVGVVDPSIISEQLDQIKFKTNLNIEPVVVELDKLKKAIEKMDSAGGDKMDDLDDDLTNLDITQSNEAVADAASEVEDTPVVKFVNKMLLDAINKGASDIHFEPYEKFYRVRYRVDGELMEVAKPPLNLTQKLTARIKVISNMDISERRVPQDGRIKLKLSNTRSIDFRVNSCPTIFGEKICLRILDASSAMLGIDALGYQPVQREAYLKALSLSEGMILVTGPTGSGKTVSLYTGLNILNTVDVNISTAEDPAEINLPGINQVNMNPRAGLDFASTLRAFLRQDPDIIMVGEIRDLETASIAIKAAQTGHLVLSTLHTNDAPQTLDRLANMGVPAFSIATAVKLIIAQRLARKLCKCKVPFDIPHTTLLKEGFLQSDLDAKPTIYKPGGCDICGGSGYKGRTGLYQVMPVNDEMARTIMAGGNSIQIADIARKNGVDDIRRSAIKKVLEGTISLEEANSASSG